MSNKKQTKRLLVGKINGLFGVKGFVKVFSYSDPREQIVSYKKWLIKTGNTDDDDSFTEINISGRTQGKTIIAHLNLVDTIEAAEKYLGKEIYIDASWLESKKDEYYYYQLEGLSVVNTDGDDLGVVAYLFDTGSNTVIATISKKDSKHKERLIPFIKPYLVSVSLEDKKIIVDWDKDF